MKCPHCQTLVTDHEANRCLDAWIAEEVMGWDDSCGYSYWIMLPPKESTGRSEGRVYPVPAFISSISAAWEVVKKIINDEQRFELITGDQMLAWIVGEDSAPDKLGLFICGVGETMPLAICRAALLSLKETK